MGAIRLQEGIMPINLFRAVAVLLMSLTALAAQARDKTYTRNEVTSIIREGRKIVAPNGVEELLEIPVNGSKQWISVRGSDRDNPVLLMIHGGPASPEMPSSWFFENGWEDYFTVVQWDQRGAGKSFNSNDPKVIEPTLSIATVAEDAAQVVEYLRNRYHKDKVFVLGHSWGSIVGITLAQAHPELLYAYIGTGQVISAAENERLGYSNTLKAAADAGNQTAVKELKALAPYPSPDGSAVLEKLNTERKWSVALGGLGYGRNSFDWYGNLFELSPEYSTADIAAISKGSKFSLGKLWPQLVGVDFSNTTEFRCPIVLIEGRHDNTTPSEIAAAWLDKVHAPGKKLVWLEHAAHMTMLEEPGRFLVHLVQDARPYADRQLGD
jgi:proline iminopeptidase